MSPRPKPDPSDKALDRLLGAQLRSTTPEFERRFDAMRRRLANAAPRPFWQQDWLGDGGGLRVVLGSAALVALLTLLALPDASARRLQGGDTAAFIELAALEDTLQPALALMDAETLDALLNMPLP
jgi:hypothetical protein